MEALKSILVLGKNGQVARALQDLLGDKATYADRHEANFLDPESVLAFLKMINPDIVINTSAFTAVDKAESEPETADLVNHQTLRAIAQWISVNNKTLVHYSTDYVFDGTGSAPRTESAKTNPLSTYGRTKLLGDQAILESGARALILRTSWVYSHEGANFFLTMLRLGAEREELSIVSDQVGSPTYAPDLASMTLKMLEHPRLLQQNGGEIYNVCGQGYCSWFEFASEIFRLAPEFSKILKVKTVKPITSTQYPTPAKRPLNSRLSQEKLQRDFGLTMPEWKGALVRAFKAHASIN